MLRNFSMTISYDPRTFAGTGGAPPGPVLPTASALYSLIRRRVRR